MGYSLGFLAIKAKKDNLLNATTITITTIITAITIIIIRPMIQFSALVPAHPAKMSPGARSPNAQVRPNLYLKTIYSALNAMYGSL